MGRRTAPKAPEKLGAKAKRLWSGITGTYELRADERRLLEDACREIDLIERMEAEMADAPLVVHGSQGQPVAAPMVQELRQHRATLKALLGSLKLPDDDERAAEQRSSAARAAAIARWRRGA